MKVDQESGLFDGLCSIVNEALRVGDYTTKQSALNLAQSGLGSGAATLVSALFVRLDRNWTLALQKPLSRSKQNFRWRYPQENLTDGNPSQEVSLERELIRALGKAGREDWSNQVPLISGIAGSNAFKKRAVDLVQKHNDDCFEFVELKIASNTPVYAAIEILTYGLLWLLSKRDRLKLPYAVSPILDARSLGLSVLAAQDYYVGYSLNDLARAINYGLVELGRRHSVDMSFRFTAFPATFDWPSVKDRSKRPAGSDLISLLDGRKDL